MNVLMESPCTSIYDFWSGQLWKLRVSYGCSNPINFNASSETLLIEGDPDFKYLNDKVTRGGLNDTVNAIRGVVVPAGVSSVYDEQLGKNMKRPFLHVRYRASQTESRKLKTWITGSVGAATDGVDAMKVHFLSERCLCVQGANNFVLMKSTV